VKGNSLAGIMAMADHRPIKLPPEGFGMDDLYLRSGIFLAPFHNHDENPTLSIERDLELLEHLDRLNYHEAWIGEHHSGGFELIACPEMFIAAAAQRTRHIRLGTGVVSLPYHNPFMLADRMVQLDHMTRGRAMFGVGPGALVHDALKIGVDPGAQRRMMNEALEVIIPLLRGEIVNRKTDWFNLTDAQLQLRDLRGDGRQLRLPAFGGERTFGELVLESGELALLVRQVGFGLAQFVLLVGGVELDDDIALLDQLAGLAEVRDDELRAAGHGRRKHFRIAALQAAVGRDGEGHVAEFGARRR